MVLERGLDTFAYRQPAWAGALRIYEVDHPASQAAKGGRLAAGGIALPANLTYAPIDFEHDTLETGLERVGFDPAARTFVSCLGVLVYLSGGAITDLFGFIARLPAGSECAFTFGGARAPEEPGLPSLATVAAELGEPWISSMEIEDVTAVLARAGLPAPVLMSREEGLRWLETWSRRPGVAAEGESGDRCGGETMIDESRFGPRMRTVLTAANNEAVELRHPYIGTEHLLLGLLDEGKGVAITVLENLGVDLADLRAKAVAPSWMRGPRPDAVGTAKRRFTSRAVRTLELADSQATAFGHSYVATEHLLLGIIEEGGSVAWHALRATGVRADAARAEVARLLGMPSPRTD